MPNKYERFVVAYLRLNGYFQVPNFIVHAGDDASRISSGQIGNYTECDTLGIRLPHSAEIVGPKHVQNHTMLTGGGENRIDVVIAEAKSGKENRPNKVWASGAVDPIGYIVRFIGAHPEGAVKPIAEGLASKFRFEDPQARYRYIVFSNEPNEHYGKKGVTYIPYRAAIEFIVTIRGQSWIDSGLGVSSIHQQWDEMLIDMFKIANNQDRSVEQRIADVEEFLAA